MKQTISVYFPEKKLVLLEQLQAIAHKQDRSVNYVVLRAIKDYIEKEEA